MARWLGWVVLVSWWASCCALKDDPYAVLGLPRDPKPTAAALKKAYRKKALEFHPDKCPDCPPEKFNAVAEAFEILSNPESRAAVGRDDFAAQTFNSMFGRDGGWREWQPGDHSKYVFMRNGKKVTLELFPDGTSEEREEDTLGTGSPGGFSFASTTRGGQTHTQIRLDGASAADLLLALGAPTAVASVVGLLCGLCHPSLVCLGLVWCCCFRRPPARQGARGREKNE